MREFLYSNRVSTGIRIFVFTCFNFPAFKLSFIDFQHAGPTVFVIALSVRKNFVQGLSILIPSLPFENILFYQFN